MTRRSSHSSFDSRSHPRLLVLRLSPDRQNFIVVLVSLTFDLEGGMMALVGLLVTFAGFLLAASSVGLATATGVRLILVLAGIVLSLGGIMGIINPAYQKNA